MAVKQKDKPNILVVDDEAEALKILEKILTKHGYNVLKARNGMEALRVTRKSNIKLALLDIKLPKMDGIELLGRFKKVNPDLIVIMITAFGTLKTAIDAMKLGAYDYITKPFDLNFITSIVEQALEEHDAASEIGGRPNDL
ncbi:MAG TPA: response regulator [Candidatus Brocadiia bacterium]|nr:response regulator [Planctomycetota bacterium]MDO8091954.1 response regulator [Candidatus Brocadiales bacterium]